LTRISVLFDIEIAIDIEVSDLDAPQMAFGVFSQLAIASADQIPISSARREWFILEVGSPARCAFIG
jgi:hypothetical protein